MAGHLLWGLLDTLHRDGVLGEISEVEAIAHPGGEQQSLRCHKDNLKAVEQFYTTSKT